MNGRGYGWGVCGLEEGVAKGGEGWGEGMRRVRGMSHEAAAHGSRSAIPSLYQPPTAHTHTAPSAAPRLARH